MGEVKDGPWQGDPFGRNPNQARGTMRLVVIGADGLTLMDYHDAPEAEVIMAWGDAERIEILLATALTWLRS